MEILFIRHAVTEEKREGLTDLKRHLTEKGKEAFQKIMAEFQEKLEPLAGRKFLLWSSPAVRASETAHIAAGALSIENSSVHDFIYEGEFEDFAAEVQKLGEQTTLLLIGHEPMLSEWTKELTGEDVTIKKGEILSLKVIKKSPLQTELQWTLTPH